MMIHRLRAYAFNALNAQRVGVNTLNTLPRSLTHADF
jgi:hypothetical protein